MNLREARCFFTILQAKLCLEIERRGLQVAADELKRDPRVAVLNAASGAGITNSLHCIGLAIDLQLYKDGVWLSHLEDYRPIGEWWKQQHPLCRWGGDFQKPDSDHFSIEWQGRK